MSQALFEYPQQAALYRVLPKSKIYENTNPSNVLRQKFITQVDKIIWQYKLASETINLAARNGISEIQVFIIFLKVPELNDAVLRCIDEAIPFPIFFEIIFEDKVKVIAAYKRLSDVDTKKLVVEAYFETNWQSAGEKRTALPIALDLAGLYEKMLRRLIPLPPRKEESLKDQVERLAHIRNIQGEYQKIENWIAKEKQFNRKVELNARLRILKNELKTLTS